MRRPVDFVSEQILDPDEQALVRHLLQKPEDDESRLVYADWLEERGDARGEFLRIQCALKDGEPDKKLIARQQKLRGKLPPAWLSIVGDTLARLVPLQEAVWNSDRARGWKPFLKIKSKSGLLDVHYHGNLIAAADIPLDDLLALLSSREVAPVLHSLTLDGHEDRGRSNGTLPLPLESLLEGKATYPQLASLTMEQGSGIILGEDYEENGLLGRLLRQAPCLSRLVSPSAPNAEFFKLKSHPLQALSIAVGYDHQNFIENLGRSSCLPDLRELEYFDYAETYMNDYRQRCTPLEHFRTLFRSPIFAQLKKVHLHDVQLTQRQAESLLAIRHKGVTITRADTTLLA